MLGLVSDLVLVGIVLCWGGTVVAVARDARARVANRAAPRAAAALAALAPFVGAVVWLCVRPAETRLERRARRLHALTLERELRRSPLYVPLPPPAAAQTESRSAAA
jgi:hypothetical protein